MERPTLAPGPWSLVASRTVGVLHFGHCLWVLGCHPSYGFSQVSRSSHYTTLPFTRTFTLYGASATGRVRAPQTIAGHTVPDHTPRARLRLSCALAGTCPDQHCSTLWYMSMSPSTLLRALIGAASVVRIVMGRHAGAAQAAPRLMAMGRPAASIAASRIATAWR